MKESPRYEEEQRLFEMQWGMSVVFIIQKKGVYSR